MEFDLPRASGDSFVLFDSEAASAWITVGQARAYHRCGDRVLVVPEGAECRCVLEGRFTRALYVYLDPAALSMSVPDALWLVDYGFRMPGITSGPPSMAGSISHAVEQELWAERVSTLTDDPVQASLERAEGVYHLVQDRPVIEKILEEELPPDEYYEAFGLSA